MGDKLNAMSYQFLTSRFGSAVHDEDAVTLGEWLADMLAEARAEGVEAGVTQSIESVQRLQRNARDATWIGQAVRELRLLLPIRARGTGGER